jgi:hypothetical protein
MIQQLCTVVIHRRRRVNIHLTLGYVPANYKLEGNNVEFSIIL